MIALQSHPRPENPEKGENLHAWRTGQGFRLFRLFRGQGQRRTSTRTRPRACRLRRSGAPALDGSQSATGAAPEAGDAAEAAALPAGHSLPGVAMDWCEGVPRLAHMTAPNAIMPARWATLAAACLPDRARFPVSTRSRRTVPF